MDKRIIFRLSDKLFQQVKDAVKSGKADTASELARMALAKLLNEEAPA